MSNYIGSADTGAHVLDQANPHSVTKVDVGLSNVENLKVNLAGTTAPSVNVDGAAGYAIGSRWVDTVADKEYVCVDATNGAAVWKDTTSAPTHTHVIADVTDFNGADYATAAQGSTADSALQSGANISLLTNDSGYITSAPVTTVAGRTGAVTLVEADITDLDKTIEGHTDVTITTIASGEVLKWDGVKWVNNTLVEAGIAPTVHTHVEADITDLDKYTQAQVDTALGGKAASAHTHVKADVTDGTFIDDVVGTDGQVLTLVTGTWQASTPSGGAAWGGVSGTLSDQTDLQGALDGKANAMQVATVQTTNGVNTLLISIPMTNNTQDIFTVKVYGTQDSNIEMYWKKITVGALCNNAGTTSVVGGVTSATGYTTNAATWTVNVLGSVGNILKIEVTGEVAKTINWSAQVEEM